MRLTSAAVEDFPARIADLLENTANRVRELTVDRVKKLVKVVALAPVILVFVLTGLAFVGIGAFRLLAEVAGGVRIAYAALGGLFLLVGAFLWSRRITKTEEPE